MAIPVFNESTMRYHDPETGRMVKNPDSGNNTSGLGTDTSIVQALNTQTGILMEVRDGMFGTAAEQREDLVASENTDPYMPEVESGGSSGPGFIGTLKNLNPFQDGIGPKMTVALLAGALFAISKFGDKLIKPLANILETIDSEGSLLDKFKDTDFFKNTMISLDSWKESLTQLKNDVAKLIPTLEEIKTSVGELVKSLDGIVSVITSAYDVVNDYIMKFDADGDGELDEKERQALATDLKDKAVTMVSDFFVAVMDGIKTGVLTMLFTGAVVKAALGNAAIKAIFTGTSFAAASALPAAGLAATAIPIAGLLLYGITTTWSNVSSSLKKTLDENDGKMDYSDFFANFFGGKEEGGLMNGIRQAFKVGGTGALVGLGVGFAVGGPLGALLGGLIGTATGMLIGGLAGYVGSGKIKAMADVVGRQVDEVVTAVGDFFGNVIAGFKSFFRGEGFMKGYNDSRYANKSAAERKLMDIQDEIAALESGKSGYTDEYAAVLLEKKKAQEQDLLLTIKDAPQQNINNMREALERQQTELNSEITQIQARIQGGNYRQKTEKLRQEARSRDAARLAELTATFNTNRMDLQLMPAYQDTMRTQIEKAEAQAEKLRKEQVAKKNAILYQKFDSMPLGAQSGLQPVLIDKGQVTNIQSNYGSRLNVDNGNSTSRLFGDSLLIDVRGSLAGGF